MSPTQSVDVEKDAGTDYAHLTNDSVRSFGWEDITVTVKDRTTKQPLEILSGINGSVEAGKYESGSLVGGLIADARARRDVGPHGSEWLR